MKAAGAAVGCAAMLLSGCGGSGGSAADAGAPIVRGAVESAVITFDANGGRGATAQSVYATQQATVGSALALNTFTRSGYAFLRWNTSAYGNGTNYSNGKAIAYPGPMTLYAVWGPSTAPGAPTVTAATATGTTASVTFAAPTFDNGSAITKYTAKSTAGGKTGTVSGPGSGTIAVTGLTPGETYTFTVTATNAKGTSALSAPSTSVTMPPLAPGAPAQPTAVAGEKKATVTVTAGATGGTPASYTVTAYAGSATAAGTCTVAGASGVCDVTGLTVGTAYTFKATATNAAGTSGLSAPSAPAIPFTVPGAPVIGAVTAPAGGATVSFTAPASNGGLAITGYTATSSPDGITGTLSQADSGTITITGLTGGTAYTFTVTATNASGTSPMSAASAAVTPLRICNEPAVPYVDWKWCDKSGAELPSAVLRYAYLNDANLTGADLRSSTFYFAMLPRANLTRAYLKGADMGHANLTSAKLTSANLYLADLSNANLTGANLYDVYLGGANLTGANLTGANLSNTNLTNTNLTGANLTGVNLSGAVWARTICPDGLTGPYPCAG